VARLLRVHAYIADGRILVNLLAARSLTVPAVQPRPTMVTQTSRSTLCSRHGPGGPDTETFLLLSPRIGWSENSRRGQAICFKPG